MLLFRGQRVDDAEQVAFSRRFGPLETTIRTVVSHQGYLPEISNLANVDAEDRIISAGDKRILFNAGNQMWHTDSSFKRVPALASLLSGREVPPEGGETEFASMRIAYERLPDATRRLLEGRVAVHSFEYSRGLVGDGAPGARARRAGAAGAAGAGARQSRERPQGVLRRLARLRDRRHADRGGPHAPARSARRGRPRRSSSHTHRWRPGDLVMWDNRCVLHRGRPWDVGRYRRVMHRRPSRATA
mgnify:CR=1 FL=1